MDKIIIKAPKKEKSTAKKYIYIGIAVLMFALTVFVPLPYSVLEADDVTLTLDGRISLAVLIFCLVLWVTEPIPFHITGILGVIILTFSRVTNAAGRTIGFNDIIRTGFGDSTVVFFIGILVLAVAITKSGLGTRVAMFILTVTGNKTSNILLGFMVGGAMTSLFITDMAVAAILTPIAFSLCKQEGLVPLKSNFARCLLITCAWAATIGGNGTPSGGGANIWAFNYIRYEHGYPLGYLEWLLYGMPITILPLIPAWLILKTMFKPEITHLKKTKEDMKADFKALGPMSKDERSTAIIFLSTIAVWLTSDFIGDWTGVAIGPALPAFLACAVLFMPGVTNFKWKEVAKEVSWESVLLIATGLSVGLALSETGAAAWLAVSLLGEMFTLPLFVQLLAIGMFLALIKLLLSSNTVTAVIVIPVLCALVTRAGLPNMGAGIVLTAALSLTISFILVTTTPTNVIPYSTGYFTLMDFAKAGIPMTIVAAVIIAGVFYVIGSFTGLFVDPETAAAASQAVTGPAAGI